MDTGGEGEEGTSGEKSLETYISPSAGQTASGVRCATQGAQTRCAGTTWRGGRGGGVQEGGTCVCLWLTHVAV